MTAAEEARMLSDHLIPAHQHDALGVGAHGGNATGKAAIDAVAVALEVHETRLGDPCRVLRIAIEGYWHRSQRRAFLLPDLDDLASRLLRMVPFTRQLQAARREVRVEFGQIRAAYLRGEEPLPHIADLVLDLALLPPRGRGAGGRIDKVMIAHHQEAPIVSALLAGEDRIHCGLQVVVDSPARYAAKELEGAGVRIEHHLLALARISDEEKYAAVAQSQVRELDDLIDAAELDVLVAEVELVRLARRKILWDKGAGHRHSAPLEGAHLSAHRVHRARVAFQAQRLVDPLRRALLPSW